MFEVHHHDCYIPAILSAIASLPAFTKVFYLQASNITSGRWCLREVRLPHLCGDRVLSQGYHLLLLLQQCCLVLGTSSPTRQRMQRLQPHRTLPGPSTSSMLHGLRQASAFAWKVVPCLPHIILLAPATIQQRILLLVILVAFSRPSLIGRGLDQIAVNLDRHT